MPTAGYKAKVLISSGSTAFTAQGFTAKSGNTWRITDATKRVWSAAVVPTFYDNAVAILAADILTIDYLLGEVTFTGVKTGPITADGTSLDMYEVTDATAFSLSMSRTVLDITSFQNTAKNKILGLLEATGNIEAFDVPSTDYNTDAGTRTVYDVMTNATDIVLLFLPTFSDDPLPRVGVLCKISNLEVSGGVDDLISMSFDWTNTAVFDADGRPAAVSATDT